MLHGANFRTPTALHVNGYLTVNGAKMSKSRGTFIQARTYLDAGIHPEFLRYYFATMLSDAPVDVDLDLKAFEERVNSHLIGKLVNIASRAAGFVTRIFDGQLNASNLASALEGHGDSTTLINQALLEEVVLAYEKGNLAEITRLVMAGADSVNQLWDSKKPWLLAKDESQREALHAVCSDCLRSFYVLMVYLTPILPKVSEKAMALFGRGKAERFEEVLDAPRSHQALRTSAHPP